jgi:hypothetical protein
MYLIKTQYSAPTHVTTKSTTPMKNRITFCGIVCLFFAFQTVFGQNKIDYCEILEEVLINSRIPRYYNFALYDTIYIYEEDTIKYFTNCDFSNIETSRIVIIPNNIPIPYDTIYGGEDPRFFGILDSSDFDRASVKYNIVPILYDTIGVSPRFFPDVDSSDLGIIKER